MTPHLHALCFDAKDPLALARFWAGVLGWEPAGGRRDGIVIRPGDDTGFRIRFLPTQERKSGRNRLHFDLAPPADGDQQAEADRLVSLGATRRDSGPDDLGPDDLAHDAAAHGDAGLVAMADPDGNEFCVLTATAATPA